MTKNEFSLDTMVSVTATALIGLDAIITPFITDGKTTLHEHLGLPLQMDGYWPLIEIGLLAAFAVYSAVRIIYDARKNCQASNSY